MPRPPRRSARPALAVAVVLRALVAVAVVTAGLTGAALPAGPAAAADTSRFDPGNLISDAQFWDSTSMTVAQVQAFLDDKGRGCVPGPDGTPCLKDFRQTTSSWAPSPRCTDGYTGAADESAATILVKTARSCGVNPQVLLVLLQKEQSLVTASGSALHPGRYRAAAGYACPDTDAGGCESLYYGFHNQVYSAAAQFRRYALNPAGYPHRAGMDNVIRFSSRYPDCGSSTVRIRNQATAGLYNYTPYQPNAAALAAGYGTGDRCSEYGNRNFWAFFQDWFVAPANRAPVGSLDSVTASGDTVTVTGWALDPDADASTSVRVELDGTPTTVRANLSRPDVGAAWGRGDLHGFSVALPATGGDHTVCVTALDLADGPSTSLGCRDVVVPVGATYTAVTPWRALAFERVDAGRTTTLTLRDVPAGATAVALNVTVARPTANTYVSACPGGTPVDRCRSSSTVNPYAGRDTPNMAVVKLGPGGTVTFYNDAGTVHLVADVQGFFVPDGGATYTAVPPTRVLAFQEVGPGQVHDLRLTGAPAGATAVVLNVTAARPSSRTYVSACPGGTPVETCRASSNLNPYAGEDTPNLVVVKLGPDNTVRLYNDAGTVALVADAQGWYVGGDAGDDYVAVAPRRAMSFQPVGPGGLHTLTLPDPPAGASAVVLNVTAAAPTSRTYVSVCPGGTPTAACRASSNLNPYAGRNIANLVVAKLGPGGTVSFYNDAGTSQLIADVQGWYVP
ncbi:hypothetical protein AB6N23_13295 [Cellulomonas sp. 179-A 9B4 NHS]|uniref:hypothetical protein n=1 Tax=Cellulomonas sp. 179-A 9B4 NHS TaxID=3142379 RepID=UPI0039A215B7